MALKINSTEKVGRSDVYAVAPEDITFSLNSRGEHAVRDEAKVKALAASIFKFGQKTPVLGHLDGDKKVVVDGGRNRVDAIKLVRAGFEFDGETYPPLPTTQVTVVIDRDVKTDEQAFVASVLENIKEGVTDLQEAEAHTILREKFGYADKQIATLYGYTNNNRIARLGKLVAAPAVLRKLNADGKLSLDATVIISGIEDKGLRDAEIEKAKAGKVTAREVLDAIGVHREANPKPVAVEAGGKEKEPVVPVAPKTEQKDVIRPRNAAAFAKLIETEGKEFSENAHVILKAVQEYLSGKAATGRGLRNAFAKVGLGL